MNNKSTNYIDGFTLPIPRKHLDKYKSVATEVATIWKEHGALSYFEYIGEDMILEGTRTFIDCLDAKEDEAIIFGWVVFASKAARDLANKKVAADSRMVELISPLVDSTDLVFDAKRMVYGGFQQLVK